MLVKTHGLSFRQASEFSQTPMLCHSAASAIPSEQFALSIETCPLVVLHEQVVLQSEVQAYSRCQERVIACSEWLLDVIPQRFHDLDMCYAVESC